MPRGYPSPEREPQRIPAKDLPASLRQRELMRFIHYYWVAHEQGPTIKEMAVAIGKSPATARHHLVKLMDKGMIDHRIAKQRGWALTKSGEEEIGPMLVSLTSGWKG